MSFYIMSAAAALCFIYPLLFGYSSFPLMGHRGRLKPKLPNLC